MAIIYDLATGKVISEQEAVTTASRVRHVPEPVPGLQTLDTDCHAKAENPCDAYMVLLQRLLRDL